MPEKSWGILGAKTQPDRRLARRSAIDVSCGLVNEPNSMSTMSCWASAQAAINAIRATGSTQRIHVPGNAGFSGDRMNMVLIEGAFDEIP